MPEDTPREEQRTMLSFAEAADRLVKDGIAESMTAEGLRRLARDPLSGWPIGPGDYRVVGKTRLLPYELLAPYMQGRRRARGPAKEPRKKRGKIMIEGQMGSQPLNGSDARTLLKITWGWLESIGSGRPSEADVQELIDELRQAGYGPLEES